MPCNTADLTRQAHELESSGAFRALARFSPKLSWGDPTCEPADEPVRLMALSVDGFESDGRRCVCRLAYVVADFEPKTGLVWRVASRYESLHDPRRPVPDGCFDAVGLDPGSLRGQVIDRARVERDLAQVSLVVSHRAAFDRAALESTFGGGFRHRHWACSSDLHWGHGQSNDLELLLMRRAGMFLGAHASALTRAEALLYLLAMPGASTQAGPMLLQVLAAAKQRSYRIWVDDAVFQRHAHSLVAHGFAPQRRELESGSRACPVGWAKDVGIDLESTLAWLDGLGIHAGLVVDVLTGKERFTSRYRTQGVPVFETAVSQASPTPAGVVTSHQRAQQPGMRHQH